MDCRAYELKVDRSHLNKQTRHILERLFLEAKWYYNDIIASEDVFELPKSHYKIVQVETRVGYHYEPRDLKYLSSQMKQEILDRTRDNIRGLSESKKNGNRIGHLKFKSIVNSIPLSETVWHHLESAGQEPHTYSGNQAETVCSRIIPGTFRIRI